MKKLSGIAVHCLAAATTAKRLGCEAVRISHRVNSRWVPVTDYLQP